MAYGDDAAPEKNHADLFTDVTICKGILDVGGCGEIICEIWHAKKTEQYHLASIDLSKAINYLSENEDEARACHFNNRRLKAKFRKMKYGVTVYRPPNSSYNDSYFSGDDMSK